MENTSRKRVSSGIPQLDVFLGDLYIGDNVLWYEDAGSFFPVFCLNFIRESLAQKKPLIYVTFDRSPKNVVSFLGSLAKSRNVTILDCFTNGKGDRSEVFQKFYQRDGALWPHQIVKVNEPSIPSQVGEAMYGLHRSLSGDVHFVIDSLTGMQALWGSEEQVSNFYSRTCPRLYELDTIAYWLVEKNAHSSKLKANINAIAQVAIDLSVRRGKPFLKILKAEKRNSKYLNESHPFLCEQSEIVFESRRQVGVRVNVGARIKNIRLSRGISQKHLAERAGLTPSTISQVEKDLIYPSLPALFRLGESLGVEVATFFRDQEQFPVHICRADERLAASLGKIRRKDADASMLLPPDIDGPAEAVLIRVKAGKKLGSHFFTHKGEELGFLIKGILKMSIAGRSYELHPGDTVYLHKETPGQWQNTADTTAELLWLKFNR
ncbi:MAG: helix-turn-helix domain-containing protein [Desulfopila sp.]|nr:helix-turn-helix domain-containing protein [Desulfopila sp.]